MSLEKEALTHRIEDDLALRNRNWTKVDTLKDEVTTHKEEDVTQVGGVHGLRIAQGAWNPTFGGTSTLGSATYTRQVGNYYKIGNMVFVNGSLRISACSGGAGYWSIQNIPYLVDVTTSTYRYFANVATNLGHVTGRQIGNIADWYYRDQIWLRDPSGTSAIAYKAFSSAALELDFSGWYLTA